MKYFIMILLIFAAIHPISYAKHNWRKKNKLGAIGAILLAALEIVFPSLFLVLR